MKNVLILLCLAVMTACAQRQYNETAQTLVVNHELDSMCMCLEEFNAIIPLGDTVAETDDGGDALAAWDNMLKHDTISVSYARGVFSLLAHEMLLVIDAQLECDPDDQSVVEFDNQWRKFLLYCTDQL